MMVLERINLKQMTIISLSFHFIELYRLKDVIILI